MSIPNDFSSTADATLLIPPFRDSTGAILTTGTVTVKIRSPNGTTLTTRVGAGTTSGLTVVAMDAEGFTHATVANASRYADGAGPWSVAATSDAAGAIPQTGGFRWGDGLAEQLRLKAKTDLVPASPASETTLSSVSTLLTLVKQFLLNRKRFDRPTKKEITYADDGTTPLVAQYWRDNTGTDGTPGAVTLGTLATLDVHEVDKAV